MAPGWPSQTPRWGFTTRTRNRPPRLHHIPRQYVEGFAQDTWKTTPSLTLTYGARYTVIVPYHAEWRTWRFFDPRFYDPK